MGTIVFYVRLPGVQSPTARPGMAYPSTTLSHNALNGNAPYRLPIHVATPAGGESFGHRHYAHAQALVA